MFDYPQFVNKDKIRCCPSDEEYRYSLDIECENGDNMKKTAMIIMQNPSKAKIDESDRTVNHVLNYLYDFGYSKIIITNVVPFYGTDIADIMKKDYKNKGIIDKNNEIIKKKGDMVDKIFVAWGWIYPKQKLSKESLKELEDYYNKRIHEIKKSFCNERELYCFCINSEGRKVNINSPDMGYVGQKGKRKANLKYLILMNEILVSLVKLRGVNDMENNVSKEFLNFLLRRFKIEREKFDRSGVYAYTQRLLAYNSNKIEGSTLTEEQTASLFDNGTLPKSDDYYRAKDVEEMNGHFLMFNKMLDSLDEVLSQELIKQFHYELKSGVFEDRANGYAIGDYKQRPNMIGMYQTVRPENVAQEMYLLMDWYNNQKADISVLAEFHARYESIHPFQDGNGRTGRLILFRECLKNGIVPVVIEDVNRNEYLEDLKEYREEKSLNKLIRLFEKEQQFYFEKCKYFM